MTEAGKINWILPDWPAPVSVHGLTTTRSGGVSNGSYASLNLGDHVGDEPQAVSVNRQRLQEQLRLPQMPCWLQQVHSTAITQAVTASCGTIADGSISSEPGHVCAVLTADCLPILLCDKQGTHIGAVHAGWRGLAAGVIEAALMQLRASASDLALMAWLGPAIGPDAFEVGNEVRETFLSADPKAAAAFRPSANGRWLADLYMLARLRLHAAGVSDIYGGHWCTYTQQDLFFSYRRDGVTGRMATLIWMDKR